MGRAPGHGNLTYTEYWLYLFFCLFDSKPTRQIYFISFYIFFVFYSISIILLQINRILNWHTEACFTTGHISKRSVRYRGRTRKTKNSRLFREMWQEEIIRTREISARSTSEEMDNGRQTLASSKYVHVLS